MTADPSGFLLELKNIHKSFGGAAALSGVDFQVCAGEVHGLVGENGAGKSTLINIASGVHQPNQGTILLQGRPRVFSNPHAATRSGIAVVHQEAELFGKLSLAENMLLGTGLPKGLFALVDWAETYRRAEEALNDVGESFPVRARAGSMPIAQRVIAQIASALHQQARVLFLDEPTASLTEKESRTLFEQVRILKDRGVGVVYVSHRLEEVLELSDRITVLRDGAAVWTRPRSEVLLPEMISAMVGRDLSHQYPERRSKFSQPVLEVSGFTDPEGAFEGIDLSLRRGEILGVYGLVGAGRSEFAQSLFGLRAKSAGTVVLGGEPYEPSSPPYALERGLAYVPEDRLNQGLFRDLSVRENAAAACLKSLSTFGFISSRRESEAVGRATARTRVKAESLETPIANLSGGNQQKVVLGRWLETDPEVLILDEPTRGVDVGAKAEIHKLIGDLAERGKGVILISSDLPEAIAMSDRVVVFREGRVAAEFDPKSTPTEAVAAAAFPAPEPEGGPPLAAPAFRFDFARIREAGIGAALLGMIAALGVLEPSAFLTVGNFMDILSSVAILSVAALGATFVIGGGGIDISVGSMLGLVGAVAGFAALEGYPAPVCLALAGGLGALLGSLNASASLLGRIHPIVVTLAGLSIYRGLMREFTGGYEVGGLPDGYRALGDGFLLGLPRVVWFALGALFLAWVVLERHEVGRRILAVGCSRAAAARIGLSVNRLTMFSFALNGAFIGLAAVLWGAYYGKLQSNAGEGLELQAIAAAVIGGVHIMGGTGTAIGTFLGACLIGVINNGLTLMKISSYWQGAFIGFFILATVLLDGWIGRRSERRRVR